MENKTILLIVANRGTCSKCGDHVLSLGRHDFVKCSCGESFIDGGFEYVRYGGACIPDTVFSIDPIEKIRECIGRKHSTGKLFAFKEIYSDWLDNIIEWELKYRPNNRLLPVYILEKQYRNENEIYVPEERI